MLASDRFVTYREFVVRTLALLLVANQAPTTNRVLLWLINAT